MSTTKSIVELLLESAKAITSEIELEKLVQRVTDIGTELSGAQFGAFFYNVINQKGEAFLLYTISGVAKEAFSKFPNPRNTKIFEPTFSAQGTVRYDDVTKQPHYGQSAPYHGMPKGHLPVRSYLAVPVVSPFTNEAIGGLFFGHSEPGMFTEESERLIEGVAIQAAIAMGNARLFEEKKQIEKTLMEQKEQYLSIFNAASDSIIIYDENGIIAEANPSACRIFGYSYDELVGSHAGKLFRNPQDFEALKEIALSGRQYSGTSTRVKKDGTFFEAEFKGSYFIFRGKPHVMSVVKESLSEREAQEVRQKSEELANIITSAAPVTLWMTNSKAETIYINQTWMDWVGGSREDQLGSGWLNAIVPEDREQAEKLFFNAFTARKVFTSDFRIRRRNGEVRWCSTHGSPYYKDGTFAGYSGSLTDITDRKLAEEKLENQSNLINTITDNTQQALFLMNEHHFCTYMNPAAQVMTGFRQEEMKEKQLHYYIHHTRPDGRHFPSEECPIGNSIRYKGHAKGEETFIHKDGRFYPVAYVASPIIENGIFKGSVLEVRDITEEKRLQQELRGKEKEAMAMLEEKVRERTGELERSNYELLQFASVASHDLKEPVRKISIFSGRLKDKIQDSLDESSGRYLNTIIDSSQRMASLIDDLLSFSRLSHVVTGFEEVDLGSLVQRIIEDLEIPIKEKEAEIHSHDLPVIRGISVQLGQVFQNLISNSLKFSHPERKLRIDITCERFISGDRTMYRILYSDNGIGFKAEQAEKIFEIFYRLHSKDKYEGTGVGLAIVKKIISLHKGEIRAEGVDGEGAVFEIVLPEMQ